MNTIQRQVMTSDVEYFVLALQSREAVQEPDFYIPCRENVVHWNINFRFSFIWLTPRSTLQQQQSFWYGNQIFILQ